LKSPTPAGVADEFPLQFSEGGSQATY